MLHLFKHMNSHLLIQQIFKYFVITCHVVDNARGSDDSKVNKNRQGEKH